MPRPPGSWSDEELERDAKEARRRFRKERLAALKTREPKIYADLLAGCTTIMNELLAASDDLRLLDGEALEEREYLEMARYLAVPPISLDDLDTLTGAPFRNWVGQTTDRGASPTARQFETAATIISGSFDRGRAKWLAGSKRPTRAEREAFALGAASIPATNLLIAWRRNDRAQKQESRTRKAIKAAGYEPREDLPGRLRDPLKEMEPGTYAGKSRRIGRTNMDVPVRLAEGHGTGDFIAVECKVSNSALNSRKRLLEVTSKAKRWDGSGRAHRFRTAAVLAGVFDLDRLKEAQDEGVIIFWEHRLRDFSDYLRV